MNNGTTETADDKTSAQKIRGEMTAAMIPICQLLNRYSREGFLVGFDIGVVNGQTVVKEITVSKKL